MTVLSKQMAFPPSGGASWPAGQGPLWRGGGAANGWWHPKAILALDFLNARYARQGANAGQATSVLSTTRSSSHLLADASGAVQSFGVNALPTAAGVGAYVGGQKTNDLLYSGFQTGGPASWCGNAQMTYRSFAAPDGSTNASKFIPDAASHQHLAYEGVAPILGETRLSYICAKAAGYNYIGLENNFATNGRVIFDLAAGTRVSAGVGVVASGIIALADGWHFCWSTCVVTSTANWAFFIGSMSTNVFSAWAGDGASGVLVWEPGCVASAFPVWPIPSGASAGVRYASDVSAITSGSDPFAGFTSAGLRSSASVLAAINLGHVGDGVVRLVAEISDGTSNNRLRLYVDTDDRPAAQVVSGGSVLATTKLATALAAGRTVLAVSYDPANGLYLVRKTGLQNAAAGLSGMPGSLAVLRLGSSASGNYLNDTVEQLQVCSALTQSEANAWVQAA